MTRTAGRTSKDTTASRRGTRGHALVEAALRFRFEEQDFPREMRRLQQEWADEDDFQDLLEPASLCYDAVMQSYQTLPDDTRILLETRVVVPGTDGRVFGTADVILYSRKARLVWVQDHKFGHIYVSAEKNPQLRLYALGALDHVDPEGRWVRRVRMSIHQPARDPVTSTHEETVESLAEFRGYVGRSLEDVDLPEPPAVPGEKQCRWCLFRDECPEYLDYRRQEFFGGSGTPPADPDPSILRDPLILSSYLEQAEHARSFVRAVDALGSRAVETGSLPSGWSTRTTQRRKITDPETLASRLHAHDVELYESVPKPLRTLRKEVGPGLDLLLDGCVSVTESTRIVRDTQVDNQS